MASPSKLQAIVAHVYEEQWHTFRAWCKIQTLLLTYRGMKIERIKYFQLKLKCRLGHAGAVDQPLRFNNKSLYSFGWPTPAHDIMHNICK